MISLTRSQRERVLSTFDEHAGAQAHTSTWSRRSYAPMHIHSDDFADVRTQIASLFPDHVIAFDVIFESRGNETAWHCDHESLGPFEVPNAWRAMKDAHFVSIHTNLTPEAGALVTMGDWPVLSWLHYHIIVSTGIFSVAHRVATRLCRPLFRAAARAHPPAVGVGNAFNNMCLHSVTPGAPRVSYVVRLVRRGVTISRASIRAGMERSAACQAFAFLLAHVPEEECDVTLVPWGKE